MSVSTVDVLEDSGEIRLKGMLVSTKEIPFEEMQMLEKRMVNHNVFHKHVHPYTNPNSEVVASIDACEIRDIDNGEKGLFITTSPLYNITDFQRKTIEYVTLKDRVDPIKFSIGKQKFGTSDNKIPLLSVPLEATLTTIPYCDKCVASVEKMEQTEVEKARIAELEEALKTAIGKAEKFEKENENLKKHSDTETFESKIAVLKKTFEEEHAVKMKAVTEQMESVKAELESAKRKPILTEISKFENDEWLMKNIYPSLPFEKLQERAKYVTENAKLQPIPMVTGMDKVRIEAQKKTSEFTESAISRLEKEEPLLAKAARGIALTDEEKKRLGI
jgi:hypothetical protein